MVSIIVITDNTNKLLQNCLDSIFAQSYRDFEVIIIDNSVHGMATDVCKKYTESYPQIRKLELNQNSNSIAKNMGLDIATGDYVFFINGNDHISENTLSNMVAALEESSADICICGANIESSDKIQTHIDIENEILYQKDLLQKLINPRNILYTNAENKLYKKSLFDNLRFDENNKYPSESIAHEIFVQCKKTVCLKEKHYTIGTPCILTYEKYYCKENIEIAFIYYNRYKFLKKYDKQLASECLKNSYHFLINTLKNNYYSIKVYGFEKKYKKIISKLIWSFGANPRGLKLFMTYKKVKRSEKKEINNWFEHLKAKADETRKKHSKAIFILATPVHGNLGDHAIVFAEKHFISKNGYSIDQIIEIPNNDYLKYHDLIKKAIEPQDIIIIDGGGNMGTLWPWEDDKISTIISEYSNNTIRIFPQTMYYDDTDFGIERLCKNRKVYQNAKDLHILLRDKKSYNFATDNFKDVRFTFTPDIVLCIDNLVPGSDRSGVLFCFREDLEKNIDDEKIESIIQHFEHQSIECRKTSTVLDYKVTQYTRNDELLKKWGEFSSSRLVITDRLHAMIFAAITGTPCIAFDNISKKVSGVYEWIQEIPYIKCVKIDDDINNIIDELYNKNDCKYILPQKLSKSFDDFL